MTDPRTQLSNLMDKTIADAANWTYRAVRPMPVPPSWHPGQRVVGDCSKGVQFLSRWADQDDPMGMDYGPYGNSQTLWLKGQHLDSAAELRVGDIVTFGQDGDEHATRVSVAGTDPLLWSFGHQGTPNAYRLSQDKRPAQFIRVRLPAYVPTPSDRLRGRTGWFAWVAWKLGEGDWHSHAPADKSVRPNVPKRIPLRWWRRYAKFLLKRKKGN